MLHFMRKHVFTLCVKWMHEIDFTLTYSNDKKQWLKALKPRPAAGPKASSAASTRGPHAHTRRHSSEMPSGDPRRGSRGWSWKRSCARPSPAPATLRRLLLMQSEAHAVVCASTHLFTVPAARSTLAA